MWEEFRCAIDTDEVIQLLSIKGASTRIIAGATDLILEFEHGMHPDVDTIIDISRIPNLDQITMENEIIHLGPMVTHNHCVASNLIREKAYPLARACWEVGAPQIRNRGTVAGNLITASPANDTITALMALDARVVLKSTRGVRTLKLEEFYTGVRKTKMLPDEMLVDIWFKALENNQCGTFIKLALRRAQAISIVNIAIILKLNGSIIETAIITLGAVAPTIIHATEAETFLVGKNLASIEVVSHAAQLTMEAAQPIDDIRASASYRREMVRILTLRGLKSLHTKTMKDDFPQEPVLLWGKNKSESENLTTKMRYSQGSPIETSINGKDYSISNAHKKSLMRMLREDAGLIGTKEGCAEGECGACTVFLDGKAVMACLVPSGRAHGAEIITIEGLANNGTNQRLHPVQDAFIQEGAVQCGYCSPGFLMSAAKLLEERAKPSLNEIQQAITGNLCRCTGYYKIINAIEKASNGN